MFKSILTLCVFCLFITGINAQDSSKTAGINVLITDSKGKPHKNSEVLFIGSKTPKTFSGRSNAAGKFTLRLPAGDNYMIKLKDLVDTAKYGNINIPALAEDEEYTQPFNVNIKFEPARMYTLDNVHFDIGKATLRADSYIELKELAEYLKNREEVKIEIAGHTDNAGKDEENLKLSQLRANAIKTYLVKQGIKAERVVAKGYGSTDPVADNSTEEGRQLNRRTEVRIL